VKKSLIFLIVTGFLSLTASEPTAQSGEAIFKAYCWGCHHQTSEAFGPSFKEIASKRTPELIMAQIADPEHTYKKLGYKRNSMPSFPDLNATQLQTITNFILQFKDKK
jgi:cytochrome c551/c552